LYPGVILALELTRVDIWQFIAFQLPVTLAAVGIGYLLLLRRIPRGITRAYEPAPPAGEARFLALVAPILAVIGAFALIQFAVPGVQRVSRYIPMAAGLCLALAVLQVQRRLPLSAWRKAVVSWRPLQIVLLVVVVRIYAAVIEAPLPDGLLPVAALRQELATMVLAYGFGYMGELLSPVHVCLVFSAEYFQTRLLRALASLVPPVFLVLAGVTLWHFAIGWILPG
jgi:hypothetical protein